MSSRARRWLVVTLLDFFIVLGVLFVARYYFEVLPRWYNLMGMAALWALIGLVSSKLKFGEFKRVRYALLAIILLDAFTSFFLLLLFYRFFPDRELHWIHVTVPAIIVVLEVCLYYLYRHFVLRKLPFYYENSDPAPSCEPGYDKSVKIHDNDNPEVLTRFIDTIRYLNREQAYEWVEQNQGSFPPDFLFIKTTDPKAINAYADRNLKIIVVRNSFGTIRHLNTFLANINKALPTGGYIAGYCVTAGIKRERIYESNPGGIRQVYMAADFIWHRLIPKMRLTAWFYYVLTKGHYREFTRVEMLGRLCMAGFEIIDDDVRHGVFFVTARKVSPPLENKPKTSMLIRLRRVGKGGDIIGVYKFRTMHAYSEYLQGYVYQQSGLQSGGKMDHDYRISRLGAILRKTWIDELPMLINLVNGDMKLVGVRPLSEHFFSLYSPEMQQLRILTKPGLIPPFYAETTIPVSLEDVEANEKRYIEQYLAHPFATDWRYFWRCMRNIVFRGARSK